MHPGRQLPARFSPRPALSVAGRGLKLAQVDGVGQDAFVLLWRAGDVRQSAPLVRRVDHDERRHITAVADRNAVAIVAGALHVRPCREAAEAMPDKDDGRRAGELLDGVDDDLELACLAILGYIGDGEQVEASREVGEIDPNVLEPAVTKVFAAAFPLVFSYSRGAS